MCLADVCLENLDEIRRCARTLRISIGIDDVRAHVSLEDLRGQAPNRPATGREKMHHLPAIALLDECPLDRADLTTGVRTSE